MLESDSIGERALAALRLEDPNQTREALQALIEEAPDRLDLRHTLATTLVRLGEAQAAQIMAEDAIRMAKESQTEQAMTLMGQMYITLAAACEDLYQIKKAEQAYLTVLHNEAGNPFALQALSNLLMASGRLEDGIKVLREYTDQGADDPEAIAANQHLIETIELFKSQSEDPFVFVDAHRGSYCEMFDHYDSQMSEKGWYAEAARMRLDSNGQPTIPIIPDGHPDYAATRVDLVDPNSGQPGRIGEQPMVVAFAGYEILAQARILFEKEGYDYDVYISSRTPWNHLPIQIRMRTDKAKAVDPFMGDWYTAGFNGEYGQQKSGFFHEITAPEYLDDQTVIYYVDMGRSEARSVDSLLSNLNNLHSQHGIETVLIGQGYLPNRD